MSRATKVSEFTILCHPFHNGAITGVDVCQRKPIVVTCGVDKVQTDVLNKYVQVVPFERDTSFNLLLH